MPEIAVVKKIILPSLLLAVLPVMAMNVMTASVTPAWAQGYNGVLADDNDGGSTPAPKGDGYDGLLAPSEGSGGLSVSPQTKQQMNAASGILAPEDPTQGVSIPGSDSTYGGNFKLSNRGLSGQTPQYPEQPVANTSSLNDLKALSSRYGYAQQFDAIPKEVMKYYVMPASMTETLKTPRIRINGMLPVENSIKSGIDMSLADINNPKLTAEQRAAKIKEAVVNLKTMRTGLRAQNSVPDSVYKMMGLPPTYVKEEREGFSKALARIDEAITKLTQ